jgi:hypothetical protein
VACDTVMSSYKSSTHAIYGLGVCSAVLLAVYTIVACSEVCCQAEEELRNRLLASYPIAQVTVVNSSGDMLPSTHAVSIRSLQGDISDAYDDDDEQHDFVMVKPTIISQIPVTPGNGGGGDDTHTINGRPYKRSHSHP